MNSDDDSATPSIEPPADAPPSAETSAAPQPEFPDAELQDGLVALCSNDAREASEEESSEPYEERIRPVLERLAASSSAEHLLAAALLQMDSATRMDLIERAVSASPGDALVLWSAVRLCSDSPDSPDCPLLREWEDRLIAVNRQNSESWIRVATNRYAAGDIDAALEAMRFASTAAESNIFWTETIELIERGLLAAGNFTFFERANSAIGIAASELPSYNGLTTMCRAQSAVSAEWADVCLRYGELVEDRGTTVIGVLIAQAVQRGVLETLGDSGRLAELEARIEASSQEVADATRGSRMTAMELATQNPSLFYSYLAAIRAEGEAAAMLRITTEVERLIRQRPELACQ